MSEPKRHVRPDDVETQVFDWGALKWLSTPGVTDADRFSAGVVELQPGEGHDRHNHPESEEILYVVAGEGRQTVEDEEFDVAPGDLVHIPEGIYHSTINTGWKPLELVAIYAPPGPERQLRDDPDSTVLPPGEVPE